jgi:hypothetical protein
MFGQVEALAVMEAAGHVCVGWYHSHPTFAPHPSHADMDSQLNYQLLFSSGGGSVGGEAPGNKNRSPGAPCLEQRQAPVAGGSEGAPASQPFIGLIVSPWDASLPSAASASSVFVVSRCARYFHQRDARSGAAAALGLQPYRVRCVDTQPPLPFPSPAAQLHCKPALPSSPRSEVRTAHTTSPPPQAFP